MTSTQVELGLTKPGAIAPLSIKETVLVQFKEAEAGIVALAERYREVAYDVKTPKGMKEAIAARADLRENGRFLVTRAEKRIKGDVNDLKRVMSDEVERLVAIVQPVEDSIDKQIKAEEERKAEEKAKRDKEEADRVAVHRANIDKLKSYVGRAHGQPIEAIEIAVKALVCLTFGDPWEEFASEAKAERDSTVASLNKMIEAETQRLENVRLAEELAAANALLAEAKAKADAAQAVIDAEAKVKADAEAATAARQQAEFEEAERKRLAEVTKPEQVDHVEAQPTAAASVEAAPTLGSGLVASLEQTEEAETMTLGQMNTKLAEAGLGITISAATLDAHGFEHTKVRGAVHTDARNFKLLCGRLVHGLQEIFQ